MSRPSIFEFAGGEPAFLALAAAHHERCLADPVLNHPFSHPGHPRHVERLAGYWAEVFGGPPLYSEVSEGQSGMLRRHAGMVADDDLGDRFVACFVKAADDACLPGDPEFRSALRAYMEWAVREVHAYNPSGSACRTAWSCPVGPGTGCNQRPPLAEPEVGPPHRPQGERYREDRRADGGRRDRHPPLPGRPVPLESPGARDYRTGSGAMARCFLRSVARDLRHTAWPARFSASLRSRWHLRNLSCSTQRCA